MKYKIILGFLSFIVFSINTMAQTVLPSVGVLYEDANKPLYYGQPGNKERIDTLCGTEVPKSPLTPFPKSATGMWKDPGQPGQIWARVWISDDTYRHQGQLFNRKFDEKSSIKPVQYNDCWMFNYGDKNIYTVLLRPETGGVEFNGMTFMSLREGKVFYNTIKISVD